MLLASRDYSIAPHAKCTRVRNRPYRISRGLWYWLIPKSSPPGKLAFRAQPSHCVVPMIKGSRSSLRCIRRGFIQIKSFLCVYLSSVKYLFLSWWVYGLTRQMGQRTESEKILLKPIYLYLKSFVFAIRMWLTSTNRSRSPCWWQLR